MTEIQPAVALDAIVQRIFELRGHCKLAHLIRYLTLSWKSMINRQSFSSRPRLHGKVLQEPRPSKMYKLQGRDKSRPYIMLIFCSPQNTDFRGITFFPPGAGIIGNLQKPRNQGLRPRQKRSLR